MPQVPVFEQQTPFQGANLQTPQAPQAIPGAFPTSTGQALEGLGKATEQAGQAVAETVIKQKQRDDEQQVIKTATAAQKKIQDLQFGTPAPAQDPGTAVSGIVNAAIGAGPNSTPAKDGPDTDWTAETAAVHPEINQGLLNQKLGNAAGITSKFDTAFQELHDKALDTVETPAQKATLSHMLTEYGNAARGSIIRHESEQTQQAYLVSADAKAKQDIAFAAGIQDPKTLSEAIDTAQAVQEQASRRMGLDDTSIALGREKLAAEMTNSAFGAALHSDARVAQAILDGVKDKLAPDARAKFQEQLTGKELADTEQKWWDKVGNYQLSDGTPDTERMEDEIRSSGMPIEKTVPLIANIKARAKEYNLQLTQQKTAEDYSFKNDILSAKANGVSMSDAMKIIASPKYATGADATDLADRKQIVQTIYTTNQKTDPATFMRLKEAAFDPTRPIGKTEVNDAFKQGLLSTKDWESLSTDVFQAQDKDLAQQRSMMMQNIREKASQSIGDKDKREDYLYQVQVRSQGKTPDQMQQIAHDLLKADPNTGIWGFMQKPQYQTEAKITTARDLVGSDQMLAIGASTGKTQPSIDDIDSFAKALGGYDKIEKGTPANNAILSLQAKGKAVTPDAVNRVLKKFKDGVWR